jgi:hypothetical protein
MRTKNLWVKLEAGQNAAWLGKSVKRRPNDHYRINWYYSADRFSIIDVATAWLQQANTTGEGKVFSAVACGVVGCYALGSYRRPEYPILHQAANIRILNSTQSITGRIVVGDNLSLGYRFLRCDHSLLGGRWIKENEAGKQMLGDS